MTIVTAVSKSVTHLQQGSFATTLASYLRHRAQQRRMRWWDAQRGKGRTCLKAYPIFGARTNLYFDSQLCRTLYVRGFKAFEACELEFVARFLRAGDVFLDDGANIGIYSLVAAKHVGPTGIIHSFEPQRKTYEWLQDNVAQSGHKNIVSYNLAISDFTGTSSLNVSLEGYDAWNSLSKPTRGSAFSVENVSTMRLDDFCLSKGLTAEAISMVKIDVEGWESHVLIGAEALLSHPNAPVLQIEFSADACRNSGSSLDALANQVTRLGYALYLYDAPRKRLTRVHNSSDCVNQNVLGIKHPERVADRSGVSVVSWRRGRKRTSPNECDFC